jgi:hypothetical protein
MRTQLRETPRKNDVLRNNHLYSARGFQQEYPGQIPRSLFVLGVLLMCGRVVVLAADTG